MSKNLSVVFTCDEGYMFPTGMAIFSLLKSKDKDTNYKIYVLTDVLNETGERYRHLIESMDKQDFRIIFKKIENIEKYTGLAAANRLPVSALYKFAIPDMLPEEDICLSLDGDIVVKHDLGELSILDIADSYAAVVRDSPKTLDDITEEKHRLYPGLFNENYFNGGVLLFNLKKMREDGIPQKLCDYRQNGYNQHFSMNQDTFNAVLYKKVIVLPFCYNTGMHVFRYIHNSKNFEVMKKYYDLPMEIQEEEIWDAAYIIHFTGKGKPWKYYDVFYADRYKDLFKASPFLEEGMNRNSYYNDRIRKTINDIYSSKDYKIGSIVLSIPRKIKALLGKA